MSLPFALNHMTAPRLGVEEFRAAGIVVANMYDGRCILVDADGRLGNADQIRALLDGGYARSISYRPFASRVRALENAEPALE